LWGIASWLGAQTWQLSEFHVGFGGMSLLLDPTFGMGYFFGGLDLSSLKPEFLGGIFIFLVI
jgi:hypothetical protein